jgi:anti-sigma B factor antagonist
VHVLNEFRVQVSAVGDHVVVAVFGEIDMSTVPVLEEPINTLLEDGTDKLIVDLDGVRFMDSTGLNLLIGVVRALGSGSLAVVACEPHIRRLFTISGLDKLIRVSETMDEAVRALTKVVAPD